MRAGHQGTVSATMKPKISAFCLSCSAWRGSLGLEPTPALFVEHLVSIFRDVRRVLRDDGVLWLNLADCYHSGDRGGYRLDAHRWENSELQSGRADRGGSGIPLAPNRLEQEGLDDGDLVGIPWRVVMALQADGWRWRQTYSWFKRAPMPESQSGWRWMQHRIKIASMSKDDPRYRHGMAESGAAQTCEIPTATEWTPCPGCPTCTPNDGLVLRKGSWRHTSAVEYVFMLTKGMQYWADGEVIKESALPSSISRIEQSTFLSQDGGDKDYGKTGVNPSRSMRKCLENFAENPGRNPRNFTLLAGESYSGAHFATFPSSLILPLIKATCPKRCCPTCGQGWAPVVDKAPNPSKSFNVGPDLTGGAPNMGGNRQTSKGLHRNDGNAQGSPATILGYRATCSCNIAESVPGITLDPFCGSGTTGEVCNMLGLRFIGIDLSMPYLRDQAAVRVEHRAIDVKVHDLPLFAGFPKEVHNNAETTMGHQKEA